MKYKKVVIGFIAFLMVGLTSFSALADNRLIPFQGRLTDGVDQTINGVESITFAIYDEPTVGTALWAEIHESVSVINGQINVLLGSKTNIDDPKGDGSEAPIDFSQARYLGITIGENNQEMVPRHQLVPSFHARNSDMLGNKPASYYSVPIGSVIAWFKGFEGNLNPLPEGWVEMNGGLVDDPESPFDGKNVPDLNGERRFLRGGQIAGTSEDDAMQGHKHNFSGNQGTTGGQYRSDNHSQPMSSAGIGWGVGVVGANFGDLGASDHIHKFTPTGTIAGPVANGYGTPRQAVETRPINMSVVWIMRIK